MKATLRLRPLGITLFTAISIAYVLCITGDLLFGWTKFEAWAPFLPGFTWPLTFGGFLIGLFWIAAYSLLGAALITFLYNNFVHPEASAQQFDI